MALCAETYRLISVMLGTLRMDIDTCINEYIDMAPEIFPVENIVSGSTLGKLVKVAKGESSVRSHAFGDGSEETGTEAPWSQGCRRRRHVVQI